jgi:hypothetical protein
MVKLSSKEPALWRCTGQAESLSIPVDAPLVHGAPDMTPFEGNTHTQEMFAPVKQIAEKLIEAGEELGQQP